jgi:hypothetical protein
MNLLKQWVDRQKIHGYEKIIKELDCRILRYNIWIIVLSLVLFELVVLMTFLINKL